MAARRCCVSSVFARFFRHVASLCFKYFSCFRCMFHLFHVDVAKVDWDVAIVVHICCKYLSPMFHLFFYTYVASVSDACLKCFICLLLYVASVASGCFKSKSGCCTCCNGVSTVCSKCFIYLRRMLQRFYLDIAKVDRVVAQPVTKPEKKFRRG